MPSDAPSARASSLDFFAFGRKNGLAARGHPCASPRFARPSHGYSMPWSVCAEADDGFRLVDEVDDLLDGELSAIEAALGAYTVVEHRCTAV